MCAAGPRAHELCAQFARDRSVSEGGERQLLRVVCQARLQVGAGESWNGLWVRGRFFGRGLSACGFSCLPGLGFLPTGRRFPSLDSGHRPFGLTLGPDVAPGSRHGQRTRFFRQLPSRGCKRSHHRPRCGRCNRQGWSIQLHRSFIARTGTADHDYRATPSIYDPNRRDYARRRFIGS